MYTTIKDHETGKRNKDQRWRCRASDEFSTVRTGTVMEDSRIPMRHKTGMSAKQIQPQTGLSYKSALFLLHRVRFAMAGLKGVTLTGTVKCDETYVGGNSRPGTGPSQAWSWHEEDSGLRHGGARGCVHIRVVADVTAKTLKGAIHEVVSNQARIMTGENSAYNGIGAEFAGGHKVVTHRAGEYINGDAHTNTGESIFALIKRGMYGVYHNVSKQHLHRYLAEYDFRWNNRKVDDGERTVNAVCGDEGKRLMCREPERQSA